MLSDLSLSHQILEEPEENISSMPEVAETKDSATHPEKKKKKKDKQRTKIDVLHCDIIGDDFWQTRAYLLLG